MKKNIKQKTKIFFALLFAATAAFSAAYADEMPQELSAETEIFAENSGAVPAGEYTVSDACTSLDGIYSQSGLLPQPDTSRFGRSVYGPSGTTADAYAVYKTDGDITSFIVNCVIYGGGNFIDPFKETENWFYVSADGENWEKCSILMQWGTGYGDTLNTEWGGGYNIRFLNTATVAAGMKYLKIVFPTLKDGLTAGDFDRSVSRVEIKHYIGRVEAAVQKQIKAENKLEIAFSTQMDPLTVTPEMFSFEDGPQVTGAELLGDGKTCILTLSESLSGSAQYKLLISDGVKSADGYGITSGAQLTFETQKGEGSYTFEDDMKTLDNCLLTDGSFVLSQTTYDKPACGLTANAKNGFLVYRVEGEISGFDVETVIHGAGAYNERYFSIYLSPDGIDYTRLEDTNNYKINSRMDEVTIYALHETYSSIKNLVPEGMKYLKIVFPTLKQGQSDYSFQRSVVGVEIKYNIHEAGIYKSDCVFEVNSDGKPSYSIALGIVNPLENNALDSGLVAVKNEDISCVSSLYDENKKCYILRFDKSFDFSKTYTLVLSAEIRDIYGLRIADAQREVTFTTAARPSRITVEGSAFKYGGIMETEALMAGSINCGVTVKGNYFDGDAAADVTIAAAVYRNDKIIDVKTCTKSVNVGKTEDLTATVHVSQGDTRIEVFVLDGLGSGAPLAKSITLK